MNAITRNSLLAAGAGAAMTFFLDPAKGNRRRALVRDRAAFVARKTRNAAGATARDVANRWQGVSSIWRSRLGTADNGRDDDRLIRERVRAELGRVTSHPRAIYVSVAEGCVTLTGDVLASEVPSIVDGTLNVRGVTSVNNLMTSHESADRVPSLQGGSRRPRQWSNPLRSSLSPSAMLGLGTVAAVIAATAFARSRSA